MHQFVTLPSSLGWWMPLSGAAVVSSSPFSSARSVKQGSYVALLGDQHPTAFWGLPGSLACWARQEGWGRLVDPGTALREGAVGPAGWVQMLHTMS